MTNPNAHAEASGDVPIRPGPGYTAVYRFYGVSGTLLYVGICDKPMQRWSQHTKKSWWNDVHRFRLVWFPSRDEAVEAEREAIIAEKPIHNIALNGIPYQGSRFPVMHLHRIAYEYFGGRPFSVRDLTDELGIPPGSAGSKTAQLRDEGLFEVVGKTKGRSGRDVPCYRAVPTTTKETP
jgi:predicted GIY-YIG superfamily endonuclease